MTSVFNWDQVRIRIMAALLLSVGVLTGTLTAKAQQPIPAQDFAYRGCYVHLAGGELTMGNIHIRRSWKIAHGQLFATSLLDVERKIEWISTPSRLPSPTPPAGNEDGKIQMLAESGVFGPTEAESMRVKLTQSGEHTQVIYVFQIFPDASAVRITVSQRGTPEKSAAGESPTADAIEHILTNRQHLRFTQVRLVDQTDQHNELAFEQEWLLQPNEALLELQGNLFFVEDTLTGSGLVFLKEAPLPGMRAVKSPLDARVRGAQTELSKSTDKGTSYYDISLYSQGFEGDGDGYASAAIAYRGGRDGRIAALQRYQRQIRQYRPDRDGQLLSNTWGDRSGGTKLSEDFVRKEIDAGKQLGVDIVEVDDGWESGKTLATKGPSGAWEGYRAQQPDFWKPSPLRFPNGLSPLTDYAISRGMRLGLWFGPDSSNDFKDWKADVDELLAFNAKDHIEAFKLDSVKLRSKTSETNFGALLDRVMERSSGKILLDLDVTAETREGYFGKIAAGPVFVENRYTDWHRYWPHQTLRNLWKLSQYVDPVRMRIEFLNPERNVAFYRGDPLAPAEYRPSTLFATTMFASPLGWFENTSLSSEFVKDARPLIAKWKQHRDAMYEGSTIPIGDAPDGFTWTGFESIAQDGRSGYLLVFRELNAEDVWAAPRSLLLPGSYRIELLGGEGSVTQSTKGFDVKIPKPLGFVWAKVTATP